MADNQQRIRSNSNSNNSPLSPGLQAATTPRSPPKIRPANQRFSSGPSSEELTYATIPEVQEEEDLGTYGGDRGYRAFGFGEPVTSPMIASAPETPAAEPLASPPFYSQGYSRGLSQSTAYDPVTPYSSAYGPPANDPANDLPNRYNRPSQSSFQSNLEPFHSSTERLTKNAGAPSLRSNRSRRSKYDNEFTPDACPANTTFYQGGSHWLTITIWILAIFSTVFSGIYLVIALAAPRWGRHVQSKGSLTASTAGVLTQLFGKLIELSFVAVFVTFLGQTLSRRAFSRESRGITLAEMSMRQWIMQPGTLLTHYDTVKYAGLTFLGALALTVAILTALYTTAASALVTPVLQFGAWEPKVFFGSIKTTFANPMYLAKICKTPISSSWDPDYTQDLVGQTCLTIDHAAQGFHNYQQFLTRWSDIVGIGNGTDNQADRPQGYGLFQQNVTVNGSWINTIDTKAVSRQHNRIINNVTLAMPHVGAYQAARDPVNGIMQPEDLDGIGIYDIKASLPSPYMNVLCAHVKEPEIAGMVFEKTTNTTLNATSDLPTKFTLDFNWSNFSNVKTPVDELFGWGKDNEVRPIFYKFPTKWNTILNNTSLWGQQSIYMLGTGGPLMESTSRGEYLLCRAKAGLTPVCSTKLRAMGTGGEMAVRCEDLDDPMAFIKGNSSRITTTSLDWMNVAITTFNALSLNNGVTDGGASNARLLMQLMLQKMELNPALPSPAEALAVMAGCSLLMSAQDSPFVEFWNYTSTELKSGVYQAFNATTRAQQYTSGGSQPYQRAFIVVLFAVFLLNLFVLIYFLINRGLVTDFSDPPNLFALAVNSPPNARLKGSCGAGPESRQFAIKWGVEMEGEHLYITDKQDIIYPPISSGMLQESKLSFGALFGRQKWKQVPSQTENMELGSSTSYAGAGAQEEEEEEDALDKLKPRDSNLSRVYSKIAKRKSVL